MLGEPSPTIKLGSVIYGRVSGYPWWPAVVTECPNTNQWTKTGKFWVSFLNDTTGAWLKTSQIRSFDRYNHDLCHEHNSSLAKFRRYQDRINKAVSIAETHLRHSSTPIRVRVLPPRRIPLPADASSTDRATGDLVPNNLPEKSISLQPYPKRKLQPALNTESCQSHVPSVTNYNGTELDTCIDTGDLSANGGRPRRKRIRSIRYPEQNKYPNSSAPQKSREHSVSKQQSRLQLLPNEKTVNGKTNEKEKHPFSSFTEPQVQSPRRSRRLRASAGLPDTSSLAEQHLKRKRVRSFSLDSKKGHLEGYLQTRSPGSSALAGCVPDGSGSENGRIAPAGKGRSRAKTTATKQKKASSRDHGCLTKQMYVTELRNVARKAGIDDPMTTNSTRAVRGVRSLVGIRSSAQENIGGMNDGTDSDERPVIERRVQVGSLETAARDVVEYALSGCRSDSSDPIGNVPNGCYLALTNGDLVSSILSRLSILEKDVSHLKKRANSEEQDKLGEDATAAGVKSAVEALAAASAAFAKARDYNIGAIRRSVEVLWPNGQFPLAGADGDLLRTVAQSLILASCKRRQAELTTIGAKARNQEIQTNESEEGGPNLGLLVSSNSAPCFSDEKDDDQRRRNHNHQ